MNLNRMSRKHTTQLFSILAIISLSVTSLVSQVHQFTYPQIPFFVLPTEMPILRNDIAGDVTYACLGRHPARLPPPIKDGRLLTNEPLAADCLDAHFSLGVPCSPAHRKPPKVDVVWTWVNGSDPLFRTALEVAEKNRLDIKPSGPSHVKPKPPQARKKLYRSAR